MTYRVHTPRIDAHGSLALAKEAEVTLDTDLARRRDALLGLGDRRPDMVLRFCYAPPMPRSLRRPVAAVMETS